jgi:hypothetical protein
MGADNSAVVGTCGWRELAFHHTKLGNSFWLISIAIHFGIWRCNSRRHFHALDYGMYYAPGQATPNPENKNSQVVVYVINY